MLTLLWLLCMVCAIWLGQSRGWIDGTPGAALVLAFAIWFAFPFIRGYVKLYRAAKLLKRNTPPMPGG